MANELNPMVYPPDGASVDAGLFTAITPPATMQQLLATFAAACVNRRRLEIEGTNGWVVGEVDDVSGDGP